MRLRLVIPVSVALFSLTVGFPFQAGFRQFPGEEDNPAPLPPDCNEKTEWAFGRLRYPSGKFAGYWGPRGTWPTDFPKADRQFVQGVRRLTRIHTRSTEQVLDLDSDELFNWPWMYGVEVGHWDLTDTQCARMREYLLRGGFFMCDDFHGSQEWAVFVESMRRVFPDRQIVEIDDKDPIFHVIYDLEPREQVPGLQYLYSGRIYEKDGVVPHWRGIYDDDGRVMVAICFNQDNGDAWEWADSPRYPERWASQAYRMGINYIIYAMTH
jgi:hypothetical protein